MNLSYYNSLFKKYYYRPFLRVKYDMQMREPIPLILFKSCCHKQNINFVAQLKLYHIFIDRGNVMRNLAK